uniref:Occlusion-derived virus envelope protein 18 n=1 Tax=Nesodiprion zhejiangensis nucleopolyhedrovirus TaxID=3135970 RepID=A0AAN0LHK9_9BACU
MKYLYYVLVFGATLRIKLFRGLGAVRVAAVVVVVVSVPDDVFKLVILPFVLLEFTHSITITITIMSNKKLIHLLPPPTLSKPKPVVASIIAK